MLLLRTRSVAGIIVVVFIFIINKDCKYFLQEGRLLQQVSGTQVQSGALFQTQRQGQQWTSPAGLQQQPQRLFSQPQQQQSSLQQQNISVNAYGSNQQAITGLPSPSCTRREASERHVSPIWIASFPGSEIKLLWQIIEQLTGITTTDDNDVQGRLTRGMAVSVKTHFPSRHVSPKFFTMDTSKIQSAILFVRNPIDVIPSYFHFLYQYEEKNRRNREAPVERWIAWRNDHLNNELQKWIDHTDWWMRNYGVSQNLMVIPYERLIDPQRGSQTLRQISILLYKVDSKIASSLTPESQLGCVWNMMVGQTANLASERDGRKKQNGNRRPYTLDQLDHMVNALKDLKRQYASVPQLSDILGEYIKTISSTRRNVQHLLDGQPTAMRRRLQSVDTVSIEPNKGKDDLLVHKDLESSNDRDAPGIPGNKVRFVQSRDLNATSNSPGLLRGFGKNVETLAHDDVAALSSSNDVAPSQNARIRESSRETGVRPLNDESSALSSSNDVPSPLGINISEEQVAALQTPFPAGAGQRIPNPLGQLSLPPVPPLFGKNQALPHSETYSRNAGDNSGSELPPSYESNMWTNISSLKTISDIEPRNQMETFSGNLWNRLQSSPPNVSQSSLWGNLLPLNDKAHVDPAPSSFRKQYSNAQIGRTSLWGDSTLVMSNDDSANIPMNKGVGTPPANETSLATFGRSSLWRDTNTETVGSNQMMARNISFPSDDWSSKQDGIRKKTYRYPSHVPGYETWKTKAMEIGNTTPTVRNGTFDKLDAQQDAADCYPLRPKEKKVSPTWLSSFPGSGTKMTWQLIEAITGLFTGDDLDSVGKVSKGVAVTIKTHYPSHTEDQVFKQEIFRGISRAILVLRNPMYAIPAYFRFLFFLDKKNEEYKSKSVQPPTTAWVSWRNHNWEKELALWAAHIQWWLDNFRGDNLHLLPFEYLTSPEHGSSRLQTLGEYLGKSDPVVASSLVSQETYCCLWAKMVITGHGEKKTKKRKAPYTAEQLESLIQSLIKLRDKNRSFPDFANLMDEYLIDVVETKKAITEMNSLQ